MGSRREDENHLYDTNCDEKIYRNENSFIVCQELQIGVWHSAPIIVYQVCFERGTCLRRQKIKLFHGNFFDTKEFDGYFLNPKDLLLVS